MRLFLTASLQKLNANNHAIFYLGLLKDNICIYITEKIYYLKINSEYSISSELMFSFPLNFLGSETIEEYFPQGV